MKMNIAPQSKLLVSILLLAVAWVQISQADVPTLELPSIDQTAQWESIDSRTYQADAKTLGLYQEELKTAFDAQPCVGEQEWIPTCRYKWTVEHDRYHSGSLSKLNSAEIYALHEYTLFRYSEINRALRQHDLYKLSEWNLAIRIMISALNKLPTYGKSNEPWNFYLGQKPLRRVIGGYAEKPGDAVAAYAAARRIYDSVSVNALFSDAAFMSTSGGNKKVFSDAIEKANLVVFIKNYKSGKLIASLSGKPDEEEVLFPPAIRFRVLNKREASLANGSKQLQIDLEEAYPLIENH